MVHEFILMQDLLVFQANIFNAFLPIATWTDSQGQQFLFQLQLSFSIQDLLDTLGIALSHFLSLAFELICKGSSSPY